MKWCGQCTNTWFKSPHALQVCCANVLLLSTLLPRLLPEEVMNFTRLSVSCFLHKLKWGQDQTYHYQMQCNLMCHNRLAASITHMAEDNIRSCCSLVWPTALARWSHKLRRSVCYLPSCCLDPHSRFLIAFPLSCSFLVYVDSFDLCVRSNPHGTSRYRHAEYARRALHLTRSIRASSLVDEADRASRGSRGHIPLLFVFLTILGYL